MSIEARAGSASASLALASRVTSVFRRLPELSRFHPLGAPTHCRGTTLSASSSPLSEVAQICPHLTAQPRHTACGLQADSLGKLALSLQPIDGGHGVRHHGQQLGPQDEGGLNIRDARRGLWHAPTNLIPLHAQKW